MSDYEDKLLMKKNQKSFVVLNRHKICFCIMIHLETQKKLLLK